VSVFVADCPRCGTKQITFDLTAYVPINMRYGWQTWYEAFCACRHCHRTTVYVVSEKGVDEGKAIKKYGLDKLDTSANDYINNEQYISLKDASARAAPEYLPPDIKSAFDEGATCLAVGCPNAAAAMFRLCVDMATRSLMPAEEREGLNAKTRRDLGLRIPWLLNNGIVSEALRELSTCIREDGNDGAHAGSLDGHDAQDLLDFSIVLLERLYTEPRKLQLAKERREVRRGVKK